MMKPTLLIPCISLLILAAGCSGDLYTENDFGLIKKIDTHMHLHAESTALAELAKEDNFRLLDVSVDVPEYPSLEEQERFSLHQISAFPQQVNYLTAFTLAHWDSANWGDYDNDGFVDLFITGPAAGPNFLYHNNGDGSFTRVLSGSLANEQATPRRCSVKSRHARNIRN